MTNNTSSISMDYQNTEDNSWMVDLSGKYATAIKNYLLADGIPDDGATIILHNAAKVLGFCPNPDTDEERRLTGIVIGKVQSGKTSNFIALTALAFDNGYSHVVVFGGTKKVLVSQNSDRIKEYFEVMSDVIVLNTTEHKSQLTEEHITQFIKMGKKIIIVALKTPGQIDFIKKEIFNGGLLANRATLIIDDEGDEASLNTLINKGKKSSTYRAIEGLKTSLRRHCFVSVTATPQANLLISSMDILSPDFGVLVDPGKGYCGLNIFHTADSKYTIEIPDTESSLLDEGIPNSFFDSLAMFFVACGIYEVRGRKNGDKFSMLIHPSQLKIDHAAVLKKTKKLIDQWKLLSMNKNDIAYQPLRNRLLTAYNCYKNSGTIDLPQFDSIEDKALWSIQCCGLHMVNGDSIPNGADKFYDYNIYVGGAMLGRGLTLKGLAITYIIRTAKGTSTVDTIQQRARWFGYKIKYLDLCRIFAVKKIVKEFREIREHEEDLWDTVREANLQGRRFKDIARIFVLSDDLRMTRTSIAHTENYAFKPWNLQRTFQSNQQYARSNTTILESFRKAYDSQLTTLKYGEGLPYKIIEGISFDLVKADIFDRFLFPEGSKLNSGVIGKLAVLLKKKQIESQIDVIWMRDGGTSKHKVDDGDIPEYMVGRRPDDYSKPAVYEGDRKQFVKEDAMQLQIHMIEDTVSGIISPTLALYIPKQYVEKLTNLVIRS